MTLVYFVQGILKNVMPYKFTHTGMKMANFKNSYPSSKGLSNEMDLSFDDMHGQFWD